MTITIAWERDDGDDDDDDAIKRTEVEMTRRVTTTMWTIGQRTVGEEPASVFQRTSHIVGTLSRTKRQQKKYIYIYGLPRRTLFFSSWDEDVYTHVDRYTFNELSTF